jgi:hypothetical protein
MRVERKCFISGRFNINILIYNFRYNAASAAAATNKKTAGSDGFKNNFVSINARPSGLHALPQGYRVPLRPRLHDELS